MMPEQADEGMSSTLSPCGQCLAGTYDLRAVSSGAELFGNFESRRDALKSAPRCKTRPRQMCLGCRDFINCAVFPLREDEQLLDILAGMIGAPTDQLNRNAGEAA